MISTVIVAFSMFSAIPMPQTEWTNKSMRYALCAFPLIGAVIGALVCLWRFVCLRMEFSEWILAAGICVLPVLVTGGIHLDGFCDTADALASHQDTEKKLQILKDPHMGAFAAIWLGCYFIAQLALAVTAAQMQADLTALAIVSAEAFPGLQLRAFLLRKTVVWHILLQSTRIKRRCERFLLSWQQSFVSFAVFAAEKKALA